MSKTIIRFKNERRDCWVSGVSWGRGSKVKNVSFTNDRQQASRFSTATAFDIALQYSRSEIVLELVDGRILEQDTARLVVEQQKNVATYERNKAGMRAELNAMPIELQRAIRSALRSALR